jgi:hypothetical protein
VALDADQIRIAGSGHIYVGAVGATAPTDLTTAWDTDDWTELGFTNEDGVTVSDSRELQDITVWQLMYPARKIITGRNFTVAFNLRQWNRATLVLAFGGGTITTTGTGASAVHTYTPPAAEFIDRRSLGVEWSDGSVIYRLIVPRGMVTEDVETALQRGDAAELPITFAVEGEDGVQPYTLLSNDPALAAA